MDLPSPLPVLHDVVDLSSVPFPPPDAVAENEARLKFVDDLSIAECVYLNSALVGNGTKLSLPPAHSILQTRLDEVSTAAEAHDMRLNLEKTKLISFNFTRNYKFEPELVLDGTVLDVVRETMLLGFVVTSNCRWEANTKHIK